MPTPTASRSRSDLARIRNFGLATLLCAAALFTAAPAVRAQSAYANDAVVALPISGLSGPTSVAVDSSGNIFIADSANNAVKEALASSGYTTVVSLRSPAGGFASPNGVAVDSSGNVFVADTGNNAVEEILAAGAYTTVNTLGSGFQGPYGVAVDANENVFVADFGDNKVKEILAAGGYSQVLSLGSGFVGPTGVAVDSAGNVFVADTGAPPNYQDALVEEITAASGYTAVKVISGSFKDPSGVAVDSHGNVFVADKYGPAVGEILATGGYTTVLSLSVAFANPSGVALDPQGNVIVADVGTSTISRILTQGADFGSVPVGTASPPVLSITFTLPTTINLASSSVVTFGAGSQDFADIGTGDTCAAGTYFAGSRCMINVSFTPSLSGYREGAVSLADTSGNPVATAYIYGTGTAPQITFGPATNTTISRSTIVPSAVVVDGSGDIFYADSTANTVTELLASESFSTPHTVGSGFNAPNALAIDGEGNLYVADTGNNAIKQLLAAGGYTNVVTLGSGFSAPLGVAVSGGGNVFVADTGNGAVKEIAFVGGYVSTYSVGTGFTSPSSIAVDASGNVFVADSGTLKEILATGGYGSVNTLASGFGSSSVLALDSNNDILVADSSDNAVKQILSSGGYASVTTVGSGFNGPSGLAVDGSGNIFVADKGNHAIKELDTADPPAVMFADTAYGTTSSDSPKTVTITNVGNQDLTLPVPASGSNPNISAGFTIGSSSTCPIASSGSGAAAVQAGTSCTEFLSFTPDKVGSISGTLVLTDDTLNAAAPAYAVQTISLNGNGISTSPEISFSVANKVYGDPPFPVAATSDSPGAFTYSVLSGPATITGNIVTLTGVGSVTLQASQAATPNYAAGTATATFLVAAATPNIVFSVANKVYGAPPFTVTATSNSPGVFTYSVVSGPATIAGNTVTLTGAGSVTLQAAQAATGNYAAGTATATFVVSPATPSITFSVANQSYGTPPFAVAATSNSTGVFTYSVVSGPATISGNIVTLTGVGSVTLQAQQAATPNFTAASTTATFLVVEGLTIAATPSSASVTPGASVGFALTISPGGGSTLPHSIQLAATGLPGGASAIFTPSIIPAGAGATQAKMTIQTTLQVARELHRGDSSLSPIAFGLLLLPVFRLKRARRSMRRLPALLAIATLSLAALLGTSGCGSGVAARNEHFTIVISATDTVSGFSNSTSVDLLVK